ncbi:MAG: hypothetical protein GY760_27670 [Deltaproteobacteria bacterium]|nr:hypothetical protein [Deltaproteobacteria bacterium]
MNTVLTLNMIFLALVLVAGCSQQNISPIYDTHTVVPNEKKKVHLVVQLRKPIMKLTDILCFEVVVENNTSDTVKVPYIYDSFIEIDGERYTQYPKPHLIGETKRVIQANSKVSLGTLTFNDEVFTTVDAETGMLPLKLKIGEHKLVLICSPYRSNTVTFELIE